uniref:Phytanoyl-CoA dioxygenase n=1 Tax=Tetradesmus obliquus TaxID=3088 RepID=A0A383VR10_TETOB|eukprot:jgi/Sobl393_1/17201/SZX67174.1
MAAAPVLTFNVDEPPERPELHASRQKLKDLLKPSYWQALCPWLHCGDADWLGRQPALQLPQQRLVDLKQQVDAAGVAQVSSSELPWSVHPSALAAAVVSLIRHGWPPSLLLAYDEAWAVVQQASVLMAGSTGNRVNMDILAWYVDPSRGDAGFSPHRDRQPDNAPATFRPDGSAMYATLWLPLTDAVPENSCLYVIPRFADPGYFEGDPEDDDAPDPLTAALPDKAAYQHIRALPCTAGAACIFTHRTIHWGSRGRPSYPTPRISISWGCADDAYEPAYFARDCLPCPPLALRLALAGAQMIVYHERFPAPPKQLALYYQAFTAQAGQFDAAYREKVTAEFLDASKEATAAAAAVPAAAGAAGAAAAQRGRGKKAAGEAAGADSTAAAAALGTGSNAKSKAIKEAPAAAKSAAAAAVKPAAAVKRGRASQQQAAAAEQLVEQAGKPGKQQPKRQKQPQQQQQQQQLQPQRTTGKGKKLMPGAAEAAEEESSEEDEGDGIDWAQVAAAARETARKAKKAAAAKKKKKKRKGAGSSSDEGSGSGDEGLGFGDAGDDNDDDDGNVMELALDAVLDAQLAGQDFHDDFEDD